MLCLLQTMQAQQPRFTERLIAEEIENEEWQNKISATDSLTNYIIQIVSSKEQSEYHHEWVCVQIFEKATGRFVQEIDLSENYASSWRDCISIDDYNFDGYDDFSIFGGYGSLDNTFSYYFLFNPETNTFFESEIGGSNLEFYSDTKTITSSNRCCAGSKEMYQTYKLIDNRMILIEQKCLTADMENSDELIFEEEDCNTPFVAMQLESVGLKKNFRLRLAIYDEDMAGGFVHYQGQKERIPIHFDCSEDLSEGQKFYYTEMYEGNNNGFYSFSYNDSTIENVYYVRKKDEKKFTLKVLLK